MADSERRLRQRTAVVGDAVITGRVRHAGAHGWRAFLTLLLLLLTWALAARDAPATGPDLSAYPWIYVREGGAPVPAGAGALEDGAAALEGGEATVSLIAVGDVMPGRGVAGTQDPLREVAPLLHTADLALGNLEAVLDPQGAPRAGERRIVLAAPPAATGWLRAAGFDLLGLANNHSLDYGPAGLAGAVARLEAADITPLGVGRGAAAHTSSYQPIIKEINGVRLAFLAFNAVPDPQPVVAAGDWQPAPWHEAAALAAVEDARRQAHAVIVSMHWGQEYDLRAAPWQREAAQALAQAGADLVLGHHPHVVQEWEILHDGQTLAAYSLGNLLFDQETQHTKQGLALRALFDRQGLRAVQALPLDAGLQPQLMTLDEAQPLMARIAPPAPRPAFACDASTCHFVTDTPQEAAQTEGIFWSGAIDLTGDGEAELVRREAERVRIYEGGEEVWQSPAAWRVVDLTLGDPNDDGRGELLLALWQEDAEGHARSQPFIVGHRGGEYKVLWGGRPVLAPILEVALGDVDGDGAQELVVLEEAGAQTSGSQAIGSQAIGSQASLAVWRWQGWHFSLFWRSAPGDYADLRLAADANGAYLLTAARQ